MHVTHNAQFNNEFSYTCSYPVVESVHDDGSQTIPRMQSVEGLVCVFNSLDDMRYVVINGKFTVFNSLCEFRDRLSALPAAERGAFPRASRDELEGSRRDLLAGARDADDAGAAPPAMRRLEG